MPDDPLIKELRDVRDRQLERTDLQLNNSRPPLVIPVLREIVGTRYPDAATPLGLRWLIIAGTAGCPGVPAMPRPAQEQLRILFGIDRPPGVGNDPDSWRRAAAERVDKARYTPNGQWTEHDRGRWRKSGEHALLTGLAAQIRLVESAPRNPGGGLELAIDEIDRTTRAEFREARMCMRSHTEQLIERAQHLHRALRSDPDIPLLTLPGWIPPRPVPLSQVRTRYDRDLINDAELAAARQQLVEYWPTHAGSRIQRYSTATERLDRPRFFFDGTSYRIERVVPSPRSPLLIFGGAQYWDHHDTSEALLFEAARQYCLSPENTQIDGHYRRFLADPFAFDRRCAIPGINTLTIRRAPEGSTFYLVHRSAVATAMATIHVIPAGEFQPSRDVPRAENSGGWPAEAMERELSIRATMIREYVEEMLDHEESREPAQPPVDVSRDEPYRQLHEALESGEAQAWYLGLGLYPLTWKPEILTVCIFEAESFDRIFADMVESGAEGTIIRRGQRIAGPPSNRPYEGLGFARHARHYARHPSTLPAGRACLELTWRHREFLGIG